MTATATVVYRTGIKGTCDNLFYDSSCVEFFLCTSISSSVIILTKKLDCRTG